MKSSVAAVPTVASEVACVNMSEGALAELESTAIARGDLMGPFACTVLERGAVATAGLALVVVSSGRLVERGSTDTSLGALVEHVAGVLARRAAKKVETKGALRGSLGVRGGNRASAWALEVIAVEASLVTSLVGPVFCEGLRGRTGAEDIEPVELARAGLLDVENADLGLMIGNVSHSVQR